MFHHKRWARQCCENKEVDSTIEYYCDIKWDEGKITEFDM